MLRSDLAAPPAEPVEVPASVRALVGDRPAEAVWRNALGGLTFRVGSGADTQFLKWQPHGSPEPDALEREEARLRWAGGRAPVPRVRAAGSDAEGAWLLTDALLADGDPGRSAVDPRWLAEPATAVRALGVGLRALHDALPVQRCPFDWSASSRVAVARQRAADGLQDPAQWSPEHRGVSVKQALQRLAEQPPIDRLVVCHGDACAPNTVLDESGNPIGHVDMGSLGIGDRWADLAVATWSTLWNYGPGWEQPLLDAYGIGYDAVRMDYYRLLWDLT